MKKQPRNPIAKALRSPHLAQRRLPARPKQPVEDIDFEELGEDLYQRHSKSFDKIAAEERINPYRPALESDFEEE